MSDSGWLDFLARQLRLDDTIVPEDTAPAEEERLTLVDLAEQLELTPSGWEAVRDTVAERGRQIIETDPDFFARLVADDSDLLLALAGLVQFVMGLTDVQTGSREVARGVALSYALAFAAVAYAAYVRGRGEAGHRD